MERLISLPVDRHIYYFFRMLAKHFFNTLTAKQTFEKLSFGPSKANCLFMFILTQNHVLS